MADLSDSVLVKKIRKSVTNRWIYDKTLV